MWVGNIIEFQDLNEKEKTMSKCRVFECKFKVSCLYGDVCSYDIQCCKLENCKLCRLEKHCTLKKEEKKK